jgi:NADH dehydrogenase FAD-containing subunit
VIVGCGFGGLFAVRALERTAADVLVIDPWMALHVTVLIGFRNRLAVLASWIYSYVFFRRGSRLITRVVPGDLRQPLTPGTPATPQRRS